MYRRYFLYPRLSKLISGNLLDVGCGIGDMLSYVPGSIGVDINPENVQFCQNRGLNAYHMQIDVLPFESDSFDTVLLDNVLEHLINPKALLSEIRRVLRPHGSLIIGVPGVLGYSTDSDHKMFYDEITLEALAQCNGYFVTHYIYMPFFRSNALSKILKQYCIYSQWRVLN